MSIRPPTSPAANNDQNLPRMGERIRLRGLRRSGFSPEVQTILKGLKKYGMFVADNGMDWAISVAPDPRIPLLHENSGGSKARISRSSSRQSRRVGQASLSERAHHFCYDRYPLQTWSWWACIHCAILSHPTTHLSRIHTTNRPPRLAQA